MKPPSDASSLPPGAQYFKDRRLLNVLNGLTGLNDLNDLNHLRVLAYSRYNRVQSLSMTAPQNFKALVVREIADNKFVREVTRKNVSDLPDGDLLIEVHYSSLNYKDALSATGHKGVTRNYPHTP
jgi:hypothetical protein